MREWITKMLSEAGGTPSSMRVALLCIVAVIAGVVVYCVARHILTHEPFDLGPNLTNLLSVTIGSLSAAKLGSKFGEKGDGSNGGGMP
jgi:hypothetical protein